MELVADAKPSGPLSLSVLTKNVASPGRIGPAVYAKTSKVMNANEE
jgi:hypothetical protein